MEELDLLKKAWQKSDKSFEEISEKDIYKMIHKNSSSNVKWILIISVIEFSFWAILGIAFNTDEMLKKFHADEVITYFKIINYVNYGIIFWFLYAFYRNYIKISTTTSTKELMGSIIKTRKTVQNYVWYNLFMIVISLIFGFVLAYFYNPDLSSVKYKIAHETGHTTLYKVLAIMLLIIVVFVALFWLFYKLLYGILLRKLNANYKELKKIDL